MNHLTKRLHGQSRRVSLSACVRQRQPQPESEMREQYLMSV